MKKFTTKLACLLLAALMLLAPALADGYAYYYEQLDPLGKAIYNSFAGNVERLQNGKAGLKITLPLGTAANSVESAAQHAVDAFDLDYPHMFYVNFSTFYTSGYLMGGDLLYASMERSGRVGGDTTYTSGYKSYQQVMGDVNALEAKVALLAKQARDYSSDPAQQLRFFHDYLVDNNEYSSAIVLPASAFEATSALLGVGSPVCEGYARAFKLLCDEVDVPCVLVVGDFITVRNGKKVSEKHMWNQVKLGDAWYAVDVTADDPVVSGNGDIQAVKDQMRYYNFLVGSDTKPTATREAFKDTHVLDPKRTEYSTPLEYPKLSKTAYVAGAKANASSGKKAGQASVGQDEPSLKGGDDEVIDDDDLIYLY